MSRLGNLMKLQQHRQIGNTSFMLKGIVFQRPAIFVFANIRHARDAMDMLIRDEDLPAMEVNRAAMTVGKIAFCSISILSDEKYGYYWGKPIVVDHFALALLVEEEQKRLLALVEKKS